MQKLERRRLREVHMPFTLCAHTPDGTCTRQACQLLLTWGAEVAAPDEDGCALHTHRTMPCPAPPCVPYPVPPRRDADTPLDDASYSLQRARVAFRCACVRQARQICSSARDVHKVSPCARWARRRSDAPSSKRSRPCSRHLAHTDCVHSHRNLSIDRSISIDLGSGRAAARGGAVRAGTARLGADGGGAAPCCR